MSSKDFTPTVFEEKDKQMEEVVEFIKKKGFIPEELVQTEVSWFYGNLGIEDMYFMLESVPAIANNVMALYGSKIFAYTKAERDLEVNLERESENGAIFIHTSRPGVKGAGFENKIDAKYLNPSRGANAFRLETYRSRGTVSSSVTTQLRCYFLTRCQFVNPEPDSECFSDIKVVSDKRFLEKATQNTLDIYSRVMKAVLEREGPVIEMFAFPNSREKRLVIGYRQRSTTSFFSALSDLYHYYDLYSTRKYVEQFSNGVSILSIYLNPLPNSKALPIEHTIHQVMKEASLIYCLPNTPFQELFQSKKISGSL